MHYRPTRAPCSIRSDRRTPRWTNGNATFAKATPSSTRDWSHSRESFLIRACTFLVADPLEHRQIVLFFVAGGFEQLAGNSFQRNRDRERPRVDERIGDRRFIPHHAGVHGHEPLRHVLGMAEHVANFAAPRP